MTWDQGAEHELPEGYAIRAPTAGDFRAVADLVLASDLSSFGQTTRSRSCSQTGRTST
jgi:hypothetical protein